VADDARTVERVLEDVLSRTYGHAVSVRDAVQLSGGASKESWAFDAVDGDAVHPLILRRDPPGGGALATPARSEHAIFEAAYHAGVPVPRMVCSGSAEEWGGATYLVMERVEGETLAPRILRDPAYADARARLLEQCGAALARIHAVDVSRVAPPLWERSVVQLIDEVEALLDAAPDAHPVFELALRWLRAHAPAAGSVALVHGDFRMGNLIVGADGLRAVLDWELSHVGDPARDLGYFCVRSWRFGADDRPAGGLGSRDELLSAYRAAGGRAVDLEALRYWEVYGTTIWGVQCTYRGHQVVAGLRDLEMAAVARRAVEMEYDVLALLGGAAPGLAGGREDADGSVAGGAGTGMPVGAGAAGEAGHAGAGAGAGGVAGAAQAVAGAAPMASSWSSQDQPTAGELLELTAEFLRGEVMPALHGRTAFHVRVAANVLGMVRREIAVAPGHARAEAETLGGLLGERVAQLPSGTGGAALPELRARVSACIRAGDFDGREDELIAALGEITVRRLSVANPRHLFGGAGGA
jgi:aminoglycoside phosphotransferase (APT) family kinase protein